MAKSTDGGANWSTLVSGSYSFNGLHVTSTGIGFAVGEKGVLLKTANGGSTWTAVSLGTTANMYAVEFVDSKTGYVLGASSTAFKTKDGGSTWTKLTVSDESRNLWDVRFSTADPKVGVIAAHTCVVFRTSSAGE